MSFKITYFLSNRASYYRSQVLLETLKISPFIDLDVIITSSLANKAFREVKKEIKDKYAKVSEYPMEHYHGTLQSMCSASFGLGNSLSGYFANNRPDLAICYADRFELLPFAMACSYLGIPLAQIQAGEDSGNIDQKVRHAVSMLADLHFVSHQPAYERLKAMGLKRVYNTGCPSIDLIKKYNISRYEPDKKFIICIFHPHTKEVNTADIQAQAVYGHVDKFLKENPGYDCYYFESNNDPGFEKVRGALLNNKQIKPVVNIEGKQFLHLLAGSSAIVGNSSSGLREASFLGISAVNIGNRQINRVKACNVIDSSFADISRNIEKAVCYKPKPSTLFGRGNASEIIFQRLMEWKNKKKKKNLLLDLRTAIF